MSEAEATRTDAKHRLLELLEQRRRLFTAARYDAECRAELEAVDGEILAAEQELAAGDGDPDAV
jgi:hypothetical protein